ncbi:aminotransferase class V-fold PLP-dependent enzyme [Aerolutibacter ruishenii]|uniref:Selenocysteine lyase/cysteine desulfurase n=1 Tax=Aerolutibacter ruishenii TaxID=686800 RepID=A0A562LCU1_9GAMM|nr:aminotransferase class V-fold PLP-dependent enzyme [Lysobacter ruishenii]TWI05365.1 selenocysteine lyase/cysteine desulfurase [Lysobacter ruishenii]
MDARRRTLLLAGTLLPLGARSGAAGARAVGAAGSDLPPPPPPGIPAEVLAGDGRYWADVARLYDITDEVAHLENGYWGSMARPVLARYQHHLEQVNRGNAWYGRREYPAQFEAVRATLAQVLGVHADEIVLTRGATEALQALIGGYNRLRDGDAVLHADTDYDSMITATRWLRERRGAEVVSIALPEPATYQGVIDAYAAALDRYPKLRLMLLTQVSHRNGLVLPVAEITEMARRRGVDVIVDAAHAVGQLDFQLADLRADFVGINLHKWIGAPVGVGAMYIRRGRVPDIDPYMGEKGGREDIRTRVHTGTANFAAYLALPDALALHQRIGVANKQARLRRLRNRWMDAVRDVGGIQLLSSPDSRLSSAIASFRLRGQTTVDDNKATVVRLVKEYGVFTVHRDGLASGACVRVTPSVFTPDAHVDRLAAALREMGRAVS